MKKQPRKTTKKLLRIAVISLLSILLIPILASLLLLLPAVQRYVVDKAITYGGELLGTEIHLARLYIEPFKTIRLDSVLIYDQKGDTLLSAGVIKIDVTSFNREKKRLSLDYVELTNPYFNLYVQEGDSVSNLQFLIDALKPEAPDSNARPFELWCDELRIDRLKFRYDNGNMAPRGDDQVDFAHLLVKGFSGTISDIEVDDSISAELSKVHFIEKSGFNLRYMSASAKLNDQGIHVDDLTLVTNRSILNGRYAMNFQAFSAFQNFFEEVVLEADLIQSHLSFYDIGFFSENARDILTPMVFSGRASGPLNNLRAEVDSLYFSHSGYLSGRVKLRGLPVAQDLNIDADIDELHFTANDFEQLIIPIGDEKRRIALPESIDRLGDIGFRGRFVGFINDFVTSGNISSRLGNLVADINIKTGKEHVHYSGSLATAMFDLGSFINSSALGHTAFDLEAQGSDFNLDDLNVKASGVVSRFDLLGYSYQNISIDGEVSAKVFEGNLTLNDPNAKFDFIGTVDLNEEIPQINCVSRVTELKLSPLNLIPGDTFGVVNARITLDMKGKDMASMNGRLEIRDFNYENNKASLSLDSLLLQDDLLPGGHSISLQSDVLKASFVGSTTIYDLPYAFMYVGAQYAPEFFTEVDFSKMKQNQEIAFQLEIPRHESLMQFIHPDFDINNSVRIDGSLRTADAFLLMDMDTLSWQWANMALKGHSLTLRTNNGKGLVLNTLARQFAFSEDYFLENINAANTLNNDSLHSIIGWSNSTERSDSGSIEFLAYTSERYAMNLEIKNLYARIAETTWESAHPSVIRSDSGIFVVENLDINSNKGHLMCNGEVSSLSKSHLLFDVDSFDLSYITQFGLLKNDISGVFTGEVDVQNVDGAFLASSDLSIDSLMVDGFQIGSFSGKSGYNSDRKAFDLNIELNYKELRNVKLVGEYYPYKEHDQLDVEVALNDLRPSIIEPFVSNYVTDLQGTINGSVSVGGKIAAPEFSGALTLSDFSLVVAYLNTNYSIPQAVINITTTSLTTDNVKVFDDKGSTGTLNASINHNNFTELNYDIYLQARDFLALNTTVAHNELYYGVANITGDVSISGYPGYTQINVDAMTNRNTRLSIPLDQGSDGGQIEYIRFVEADDRIIQRKRQNVVLDEDIAGLNLDFKLSVNDNAEVQIIFDEKIGDVIKVRGNGDMIMNIDNRGTFNMYGDYIMTSGDYLFTLQNVINKRFNVENGSRITWSGSPIDATVDLTAVYDLRASPIGLTASVGDTSEVYQKRMPVDVYLMMKGALLEPTITFDIDLPSLPESDIANQLLDKRTTSEQEMNEQVFALLLTNNFFNKSSNFGSALTTSQNTTYEMVSNQFSNWVSQYFDNIDFGVNYRPGDEIAGNQTEVNVSTELFNDRVLVEVNGSVQGDHSATKQSNNVAGEFNIEYKINRDGSLRAKVFNEANNYNPTNLNQSPYTQGVGLFYRREFDHFFRDLFTTKKSRKAKSDRALPEEAEEVDEEITP